MVPETGGGLSGFLARGLWMVYQHFPSPDKADWAWLLLSIGLLTYVLYIPQLWRSVSRDMSVLKQQLVSEESRGMQGMTMACLAGCSMLFFLWFFHTDAGKTFVLGREDLFGSVLTRSNRLLHVVSLFVALVGAKVLWNLTEKIEWHCTGIVTDTTHPFRDRSLVHLLCGGGIFVYTPEGKRPEVDLVHPEIAIVSLFTVVLLCVCYWKWSATSIWLMWCFVLSSLLMELCRMVFVAILHKRTFG